MKLATAATAILMAAGSLNAAFLPAEWQSAPLTKAAAKNEWYFFPDDLGNSRVLVKATAGTKASFKLLTGGPPVWTDAFTSKISIGKQGTFVPAANGGGFLVASQGNTMKVAIFDNLGNSVIETIDPNPGAYTGISAELDATGGLHVGYIYNSRTICYARRNSASNWTFTSQLIPGAIFIHDTAVVPLTTSNVSLYFTQTYTGVRTLWRAKPAVALDGRLYITWASNPLLNVENFVAPQLRGSRVGAEGRVYFFGSGNAPSWKLKRYSGIGGPIELETAGNVSPKSIRVAIGPDGRQRVAWYNETLKRVHYLKPINNGPDVPIIAGYPVVTTSKQSLTDLSGFHFTPDGTPCLLYRTTLATAFVATPREDLVWTGTEW